LAYNTYRGDFDGKEKRLALMNNKAEYQDYLEELVIDKNSLDDECVESPALFDKWSRLEIVANEERDDAKSRLDVVRAKVELELRGMSMEHINQLAEKWTGKPHKLKSLSEGTIRALVCVSPEVQKAQKEYEAVASRASSYTVARKSFERRHSSLDNLVRLHGQGYFAAVEGRETKRIVAKKIREKLAAQIERSFPERSKSWLEEGRRKKERTIKRRKRVMREK